MSDYISRQAAFEALEKRGVSTTNISRVPIADVRENVKGEWIHDEITRNGNTVYTPNAKCSVCDCYVFQESNFCPNCGADMRREDNGRDEENHNRV